MFNYRIGGLLGDFFNCLSVPKRIYDLTGEKADIYICDHEKEPFKYGLNKTYNDLKPILLSQPYIESFKIYNNEHIDIDMIDFRYLRKTHHRYCINNFKINFNWLEFLFITYIGMELLYKIVLSNKKSNYSLETVIPPKNYKWLYPTNIYKEYKNTIILNRPDYRIIRDGTIEVYNSIIEKNETLFLCYEKDHYNNFPLKHKTTLLHKQNLEEIINIIASCKQFVGNQSSYYCIANALNVDRTIEVNRPGSWRMYVRENVHYDNVSKFGHPTFK